MSTAPVTKSRYSDNYLQDLNSEWDWTALRAHILNIVGTGLPTLSGKLGVVSLGDGVVPHSSLKLPGTPVEKVPFVHHTLLRENTTVMRKAIDFLTTDPETQMEMTNEAYLKSYEESETKTNSFVHHGQRLLAYAARVIGKTPQP